MAEQLADHLRQAGYKLTAPRLAVLKVLETEEEHLSHAEVLERGRRIYPALGRATVYRTLELLTALGLLRPIHLGDGGARFALLDGGRHHHLVCLDCGTAIPFDECAVGEAEQVISERFGFQVESHLLEFYGLCGNCREYQGEGKKMMIGEKRKEEGRGVELVPR